MRTGIPASAKPAIARSSFITEQPRGDDLAVTRFALRIAMAHAVSRPVTKFHLVAKLQSRKCYRLRITENFPLNRGKSAILQAERPKNLLTFLARDVNYVDFKFTKCRP